MSGSNDNWVPPQKSSLVLMFEEPVNEHEDLEMPEPVLMHLRGLLLEYKGHGMNERTASFAKFPTKAHVAGQNWETTTRMMIKVL